MKKSELLELIKSVIKEESDYQQLFKHMLDKSGKDINSMSDAEKKKFFNAVDIALVGCYPCEFLQNVCTLLIHKYIRRYLVVKNRVKIYYVNGS